MELKRVFLPSRIYRGRLAVDPVWHVTDRGATLEFRRKRDAKAYIDAGVCEHEFDWMRVCQRCGGSLIERVRLGVPP